MLTSHISYPQKLKNNLFPPNHSLCHSPLFSWAN